MPRNLYIGDWHYNHANCISYDNRPFRDVNEMNDYLIKCWQKTVKESDTVYILGDMFWKTPDPFTILNQLPGHKILIIGNHDRGDNAMFRSMFEDVSSYLEIQDGKRRVVLSHYPIISHKNMLYGWAQLYAHVHTGYDWRITEDTKTKLEMLYDKPIAMYNTGCMLPWMGYTPRTLDEIEAGYAEWRKAQDAMGPSSHPEIDRMLTLSTAHVSEHTAEMLSREPETDEMQLSVYTKSGTPGSEGYGWYVYVPQKCAKSVPPDLARVIHFAQAMGCRVLCLDADGPEEPSLEVFDW